MDVVERATTELEALCSNSALKLDQRLRVGSLVFEKDDDSNGHIDFITAASVS